jgi:hypothetical protein
MDPGLFAGAIGQRDTSESGTLGRQPGIGGEGVAAAEPQDHAARLEEGVVVVAGRRGTPAEALVECPRGG